MNIHDAMLIKNKINAILSDIRAANPTDKHHAYPDHVKEIVKKLQDAKEILVKQYGLSK